MNYKEIQQQMHHYQQQQQHQQQALQHLQAIQNRQIYGQTSASNAMPSEAVRQIMRGQHQRQVSSPVSHRQERPISNYYEYDTAQAVITSHNQQNNVNNNVLSPNENTSSQSLTRRSKKYTKPETQHTGAPHPVPIARQQPIYQTNQLKIYGSIHSNGYSGHSQSQPNPPQVPIYDSIHGNINANNTNTNGYPMPSKYQSLRTGSKV